MHSRTVGSAGAAVVVALATACSKPPPPPPPAAQRTTCGDVLSVALPAGFTCTPHPSPVVTAAFECRDQRASQHPACARHQRLHASSTRLESPIIIR